jgi:hypothetical protein
MFTKENIIYFFTELFKYMNISENVINDIINKAVIDTDNSMSN